MRLFMGYFVVNTDKRYVPGAEEDMIKNKKAAAYADRADKMDRLRENDRIFLFSNGNGIIVRGTATGGAVKTHFTDSHNDTREEKHVKLKNFENISHNPLTAEELLDITGIRFSQTLIELRDEKAGETVWDAFSGRIP